MQNIMKPKNVLTGLTVLWVFVALFEGASSLISSLYTRKMGRVMRAFCAILAWKKAALLVILAVSNIILFMRHVDE